MGWEPNILEQEIIKVRREIKQHTDNYLAGKPSISPVDYDNLCNLESWLSDIYLRFNN